MSLITALAESLLPSILVERIRSTTMIIAACLGLVAAGSLAALHCGRNRAETTEAALHEQRT